jgi:hypothetical protein
MSEEEELEAKLQIEEVDGLEVKEEESMTQEVKE